MAGEGAMITSELLNRLEESKGGWKSMSAEDWELYTSVGDVKKLSKKAAGELNKAMTAISREVEKTADKRPYEEEWWAKQLGYLYDKHIKPLEKKYRETGITDTEPHYHIAQGMIDMVKSFYGIQGWTDLGDYI
jgi:hypothetical protein